MAGQLRYSYDAITDRTLIEADLTGDGRANMAIVLTGEHSLTAADFLL